MKRFLLIVLALVVLLVAGTFGGAKVAQVRLASQIAPPPGRLIDVGGRTLHLDCRGVAQPHQPTVVLETGLGESSLTWAGILPPLAATQRVCAYDRAGYGWSDPGPLPRTPEQVVADLHALLQASGESGPYVLVGHSLGGRYVRLFAATYPQDMAGIVLVDARSEYHDHMMSDEMRALIEANNQPNLMMTLLGRVEIMRLFGAQLIASQIPELKWSS